MYDTSFSESFVINETRWIPNQIIWKIYHINWWIKKAPFYKAHIVKWISNYYYIIFRSKKGVTLNKIAFHSFIKVCSEN